MLLLSGVYKIVRNKRVKAQKINVTPVKMMRCAVFSSLNFLNKRLLSLFTALVEVG